MKRSINHNEAYLLEQLAKGDMAAFNTLYDQTFPMVSRLANQVLHSEESAMDLAQEVFITVWEKRTDFHRVENFKNYIFIMARNSAFQALKKLSRETLAQQEFARHQIVTSANSTELYINHRELDQKLAKTISRLPRQQQRVFQMAKFEGKTHEAIAIELNISPKTVKFYMTEANKFIRQHLEEPTSISLAILLLSV